MFSNPSTDGEQPSSLSPSIRPKNLILTLFGDYIRPRGGEIWTGSLIRLMKLLGVPSGQAVRSTLSRTSQRGWLQSRKVGRRSFYSLTPRGQHLLDEGAQRIFLGRPEAHTWDGRWRLLSYHIPDELSPLRARLRQELGWIGFGRLDSSLYVAPYDYTHELNDLFGTLDVRDHIDLFTAEYRGPGTDQDIVRRVWDLESLNAAYADFLAAWRPRFEADQAAFADPSHPGPTLEECFVRRFMLVHEYRVFPFIDPDLPVALLPADWLGTEARVFFQAYYDLLTEPALAFFDAVFTAAPPEDEDEDG
ncbi:MAG: hypothetical protein M5U01_06375 [Ardenticatenaceae bacterium]|nr:hypothetical protein [Ardenticatenaceae bacterium]